MSSRIETCFGTNVVNMYYMYVKIFFNKINNTTFVETNK